LLADCRCHLLAVGIRDGTGLVLAQTFLTHPGQVLSRQQLLSRVWGYDFDGGSNIVDVYVGYRRRKLGADFITTVRGVGYRLRETVDE
jgi:DNA-binding response OmpR family regulator